MARAPIPLNALKAFEAAARHLSFTLAANELCVTQSAISHQVKGLEARLGVGLFRRSNRGLKLTDEGLAIAPTLFEAFGAIDRVFEQFESGGHQEVITVSVVGAFALGALMEKLPGFRAANPRIDLRLLTNNNKVDLVAEGLDYAIRFGDGAWQGLEATPICKAPLSPLCAPALAKGLSQPSDLLRLPLLRSYRPQDWLAWFKAAGLDPVSVRGPLFDSSPLMVQAAARGEGVALVPHGLFRREIEAGQVVRPFDLEIDLDGYWLVRLRSKPENAAMRTFRDWVLDAFAGGLA